MTEAAIINLFTVFRVLLVGGIFALIPLVTRKGLLFGVYVGETFADGEVARRLVRRWYLGCLLLVALSLAVGLGVSLAGRPIAGNVAATVVLLVGCLGLYLSMYYAARAAVPPAVTRQASTAIAPLDDGEPAGALLAKVVLGVTLAAGLATVVYATVSYEAMPDRVPTHFGLSGEPDAWTDKSVVSAMLLPTGTLVLSPFLALMALLTANAKRSVRGGSGGRSLEAQTAFRAAIANAMSGAALFTCALMTLLAVQSIRVALGQSRSLGVGIWIVSGGMAVFLLGYLGWVIVKYGQGGALAEEGSATAPLTNGLADNEAWVWGVFYVNRNDPSIMVEKRFGIGYTINFGNPKAVAILLTAFAFILGLTAIAVVGSL